MNRAPIQGRAIPTLPAANLDETLGFYRRLGFEVALRQTEPDAYAIVRRDDVEIHFFGLEALSPTENYAGCYIRVADARALFEEFRTQGIERLGPLEDRPWRMREFHLVDPSGNLVRIGQPIQPQDPEPRDRTARPHP